VADDHQFQLIALLDARQQEEERILWGALDNKGETISIDASIAPIEKATSRARLYMSA
jgi:hypothetical protein